MLLTESLRIVFLALFCGASSGDPGVPTGVLVSEWMGSLPAFEERLVVDVAVAATGDFTFVVGSVKNADGENMAFLIPTAGEGLVSSTWGTSSHGQDFPVTLWSDGNCILINPRRTKDPRNLSERAPWLGWGIRSSDVAMLSVLQQDNRSGWPVRELFFGLSGFYPDDVSEGDAVEQVDWTSSRSADAEPRELEKHWNEIVERYLETRTRLRRVEELTLIGASSPPTVSRPAQSPR
jgi:hypothetical protein